MPLRIRAAAPGVAGKGGRCSAKEGGGKNQQRQEPGHGREVAGRWRVSRERLRVLPGNARKANRFLNYWCGLWFLVGVACGSLWFLPPRDLNREALFGPPLRPPASGVPRLEQALSRAPNGNRQRVNDFLGYWCGLWFPVVPDL